MVSGTDLDVTALANAIRLENTGQLNAQSSTLRTLLRTNNGNRQYRDLDADNSFSDDATHLEEYIENRANLSTTIKDRAEDLIDFIKDNYSTLKNVNITYNSNTRKLFQQAPETNFNVFQKTITCPQVVQECWLLVMAPNS